MATRRERPGTWILKNSGGSTENFTLDNDQFEIEASSNLRLDAKINLIYDDTNLSVFRTPPEPQALVNNIGAPAIKSGSSL
tara:strand:+ start:587 stop:829 length:243 start_codon:yes stop_codon:yes gene_type:complete